MAASDAGSEAANVLASLLQSRTTMEQRERPLRCDIVLSPPSEATLVQLNGAIRVTAFERVRRNAAPPTIAHAAQRLRLTVTCDYDRQASRLSCTLLWTIFQEPYQEPARQGSKTWECGYDTDPATMALELDAALTALRALRDAYLPVDATGTVASNVNWWRASGAADPALLRRIGHALNVANVVVRDPDWDADRPGTGGASAGARLRHRGRDYAVRLGPRGGEHIVVRGKKVYVAALRRRGVP
jgi:hypothetical protein